MQDELISRQAAIDAVNDVIADYVPNLFGRYEALPLEMASAINRLPSVNPQPKTRWIPVSERLPEEGESVLTQAMFNDDMKMCVSSRIDWNYWTGWGTRNINIIAWMPLPEPYKAESEE